MTTRTPDERARQISSGTGVPQKFEVLYEQRVTDCQKAERLIHQRLAKYRSSSDREFFVIPLKIAVTTLNEVAADVGLMPEDEANPLMHRADDELFDDEIVTGEINALPKRPKKLTRTQRKKPIGPVSFEDHVAFTDASRKSILLQLREFIVTLDDRLRTGESVTSGQRVAYKIPGDKNFIEIKVLRSTILVRTIETKCSDPRGVVEKIPDSHGWGDLKEQLRIRDASDAEYAHQFIDAAYKIVAARN